MKKNELMALTVAELKSLARKKKITLRTDAKKADIVAAILKASGGKKGAVPKKTTSASRKAAAAPKIKKQAAERRKIEKKTTKPKEMPEPKTKEEGVPIRDWKMPAGVEEPLMAQERVSDAKYYTGTTEQRSSAIYEQLPHEYGVERIALMARDPYTAFTYWEVPQPRIDKEKAWFGWDSSLVVRIYDVTGVVFDGTNANAYFDQEVYDRVGDWYFDFGRPAHSFCADLGLRAPDGRFLTLVRSNAVTMPRDGVSDVLDEEWMIVDEEFLKLYGGPGGISGGMSSPQIQELIRKRRMLEITSPGAFQRRVQKTKRK